MYSNRSSLAAMAGIDVHKPLPQPQAHTTLEADAGMHQPALTPMPTGEMPPTYDQSCAGSSVGVGSSVGDPRLSMQMSPPGSPPTVPPGAEPANMGFGSGRMDMKGPAS